MTTSCDKKNFRDLNEKLFIKLKNIFKPNK